MAAVRMHESDVEEGALEYFEELGYETAYGSTIGPNGEAPEREDYRSAILPRRLRESLERLNPGVPVAAVDEALRQLASPDGSSLEMRNHTFHRMLVDGIAAQYLADDGLKSAQVQVLDFDDPAQNDWLAVNQYTVTENGVSCRADVVVLVNGLPLALLELKNAVDQNATLGVAYEQVERYKRQVPELLQFNEAIVISDGTHARMGSLTAGPERFMPWRKVEPGSDAVPGEGLRVLVQGAFHKQRFMDLIKYGIVFDTSSSGYVKLMVGYHQFEAIHAGARHALRATGLDRVEELDEVAEWQALWSTVDPESADSGNHRIGVVWHTQGSGKSLTMALLAGRLATDPRLMNPTVVVITDRNDLDQQLFTTFGRCKEALRQDPVQATGRAHLRKLLRVEAGGVVFTTVQKFFPEAGDADPCLSARDNIIVMADEAHRSQYDFIDGFARHMHDALPNASFMGFTGTPIEFSDKNTRAVFGDYISVYDIGRAVEDHMTVPIYYEGRLAKLDLAESEQPKIEAEFEEATEADGEHAAEALKRRWTQLCAVVGAPRRLEAVAKDFLAHWKQRLEVLDGKAMIVCMSREIAVDLYDTIVSLEPDWHSADDGAGVIKVVMSGGANDPEGFAPHIRDKAALDALAKRMRDPGDPLRVVIVRDMWLTGFDAPCLHTMYVDKFMKGHGLMQAIARVNRVFRDKPGGLIVDYIGIAEELKEALAVYANAGGKGAPAFDQAEAVRAMQEQYEVCCDMLHGYDWSRWFTAAGGELSEILLGAIEHVLARPAVTQVTAEGDSSERTPEEMFIAASTKLSRLFALAVPHEEAIKIRDDVSFFQQLAAALMKDSATGGGELVSGPSAAADLAVKQLVSRAVISDGIVELVAGGEPPSDVLSADFLEHVRDSEHPRASANALERILRSEIRAISRGNQVQAKSFLEKLTETMRKYQNHTIDTAQVIEELIGLAEQIGEAANRGEALGLTDDEVAFYDALGVNDSAVAVMGDEQLREIAQEIARVIRANVTVDWAEREAIRARLRVVVKRVLRSHGYPPDKQRRAIDTVIEQAEVISAAVAQES
jgi:type I restriction enzyme, R subunit